MELICRKPYAISALREAFPQAVIRERFQPCGAQAVIADPQELTRENLDQLPDLTLALCARAGFDAADTAYLRQRGIHLCNARGLYSVPIAEDIVCKILLFTTNALIYQQQARRREYRAHPERRCLSSMTVGFLGTGSIARETAARLRPFGCRILGYKRSRVDTLDGFDALYYGDSLNELLPQCDIVVASLDLNPSTFHLIGVERLSLMKEGAALINIARGPVVDEAALVAALQSGHLAYAGLDVFETEPLPATSPLWDLPQAVVTPHASGLCVENHPRYAAMAVENLRRWQAQQPLQNQIF